MPAQAALLTKPVVAPAQAAAATSKPVIATNKPAIQRIRFYTRQLNAYSKASFAYLKRTGPKPPKLRFERLQRYKQAMDALIAVERQRRF